MGVARRQLRPRGRPADEVDPDLHRRHPVHGGGTAPHRGRHRSRDRRDHLDLPRAQHDALGAVDAPELRQGRGVRRNRWPRRHLLHLPGVLPARAGCEDRPSCGGIRPASGGRRVPGDGRCRSAGAAARRLGTVGGARRRVRSRLRHPARTRLHHGFVAAHCGEQHRGGGQLGGAGLQPDPHRERAGRHPRLRRAHGRSQVEVPRDPAARGVRARDLGERRLDVRRRRLLVGADVGRPGAGHGLHPHQPADHRLLRRLPARRQPLRHQRDRAERGDRRAGVALPDRTQRPVELRPPQRAHRRGPGGGR